jgi:riboflavin kinase/FMN adenylyltransferase
MRIHHGLPQPGLGDVALTIGSFDGVHLAHQAVIRRTVEAAETAGLVPTLITFEPNPRCVIDPANCPQSITTLREKLDLIAPLGIAEAIVLEFDRRLAGLSAREFIAGLGTAMRPRKFVLGHDFGFGHRRAGNAAWLREHGFEVEELAPVRLDGAAIHSSDIRRLLTLGDVAAANRLLGREFSISGLVEPGDQVGRTLGFPTANLAVEANKLVCGRGIYAGRVLTAEGVFPGALSVGYRPTFGGTELRVEAYVLDFQGDLYQQRIEVSFTARIRDEVKFETPEALATQISEDVKETRKLLGRHR